MPISINFPRQKEMQTNRFALFFYLICLLVCQIQTIYAQNLNYKKHYNMTWSKINTNLPNKDTIYNQKNKHAIIIDEQINMTINNVENSTLVKRNAQILFFDTIGIQKYGLIVIPEPFDPQREQADLPLQKRQTIHRPKFFNLELLYIIAKIIDQNGDTTHIKPIDWQQEETIQYNARTRHAFSYLFDYRQHLKPNHTLQIEYAYFLPYQLDYHRLFFHSNIYKHQTQYSLTFPKNERYVFNFQNNAQPTDTTEAKNKKTLIWKFQQLQPCINETNAKPYLDLPNVSYYIHNKNFGKWINDQIEEFSDYSWIYVLHDRLTYNKDKQFKTKKKLNLKEIALNNFLSKQTSKMNNTATNLQKLFFVHHYITDSFNYKKFDDHFANIDKRIAKLPNFYREALLKQINTASVYNGVFDRLDIIDNPYDNLQSNVNNYHGITQNKPELIPESLSKKTLYNINTNAIYDGILTRLKNNFSIVSIADNRIHNIQINKCMPIWGENNLFAVTQDNQNFYIIPKTRRFGYRLNELPFYLENTNAVFVEQLAKTPTNPDNIRFFENPNTNPIHNFRIVNCKTNINSQKNEAFFDVKLILSGQYSSTGREAYQFNTNDSTINPLYYHRIYQLKNSTLLNQKTTFEDQQFPFKTTFEINYTQNQILTINNSTYHQLNLHQWIKHVIDTLFDKNNRYLTYYPDFEGSEQFNYEIIFDKPIQIIPQNDIHIQNEFGKYLLTIKQTNDTTIFVHSTYHIKNKPITPNHANKLAQLFDNAFNTSKLIINYTLKTK